MKEKPEIEEKSLTWIRQHSCHISNITKPNVFASESDKVARWQGDSEFTSLGTLGCLTSDLNETGGHFRARQLNMAP